MSRRIAAAAALALLTGCGGGSPEPQASETTTPSASATKKPKPKPKPSASRSASPTPSVSPTAPPPASGDPLGTAESLVTLVEPGEPRPGTDCAATVPDIETPACAEVKTAGGTLLWATGRIETKKAVRLLVQTPQGYVARYEGRDATRSWAGIRVYAAPLTGHGVDGVVVFARLIDGAATYDLLTWVQGGPLVLRAHRQPLADGRLQPKDVALDEYELAVDKSYVRRRVAWDGRRFLVSKGVRSTQPAPR